MSPSGSFSQSFVDNFAMIVISQTECILVEMGQPQNPKDPAISTSRSESDVWPAEPARVSNVEERAMITWKPDGHVEACVKDLEGVELARGRSARGRLDLSEIRGSKSSSLCGP